MKTYTQQQTKHTAGPWHTHAAGAINGGFEIWADGTRGTGLMVADVARHDDARLIAAAPELLEALEFAMLAMACDAGDSMLQGEEWRAFSNKARAAIAKAEGRA